VNNKRYRVLKNVPGYEVVWGGWRYSSMYS